MHTLTCTYSYTLTYTQSLSPSLSLWGRACSHVQGEKSRILWDTPHSAGKGGTWGAWLLAVRLSVGVFGLEVPSQALWLSCTWVSTVGQKAEWQTEWQLLLSFLGQRWKGFVEVLACAALLHLAKELWTLPCLGVKHLASDDDASQWLLTSG